MLDHVNIYLKKGYCLFKLDEFNKAIDSFKLALGKYNQSNQFHRAMIHIWLAKMYYNQNKFSYVENSVTQALDILDNHGKIDVFFISINWDYEIAFSCLLLADVCSKKGDFVEADKHYVRGLTEKALQTPNNYREHARSLLHINKPFEAMLCYKKSIENYANIPSLDLQYAYFYIAKLYFENDFGDINHENAEKYFLLALPYFKQDEGIPFQPKLNTLIPPPLIPPENEHFIHVCLGEIYSKKTNWQDSLYHYSKGIKAPQFQTARHYFALGLVLRQLKYSPEAIQYFDLATKYLENNPDPSVTVEQISAAKNALTQPVELKTTSITLPPLIKEIFAELTSIYTSVYLGGSTIHTLLNNEALNKNQDLDFWVLGEPTNLLVVNLNFNVCQYNNGNLYQKRKDGFSIDCYVKKESELDLRSSDFTISNLYCDKEGTIYDESGRGLQDFINQRLDTIRLNSSETFKNDAACLLRGIKLMMRGFKPTEKVHQAMHEFTPSAERHNKRAHLNAVTQKLLKSSNANDVICKLFEYRLLEKFFGVSNDLTPEEALLELKKSSSHASLIISKSPYSSFYSSSNAPAPASSPKLVKTTKWVPN